MERIDKAAMQPFDGERPMISVVLCTYNREASLSSVLESLEKQQLSRGEAWELIVVDNNSKDDTRDVVERFRRRGLPLQYVFEPRQGKSYALNTGIANSRGAILAFTDDDVLIDSGWLEAYARGFERHDCIGAGGRIRPLWRQPAPRWFSSDGEFALMQAIVHLEFGPDACPTDKPVYGANMAFRREAFERFGMFRTDLGPRGDVHTVGEDTDLCARIRAGGGRIFYFPQAVVDHPVEAERATKAYFLHWYFHFGRMSIRKAGLSRSHASWLGVPRYLLRSVARNALKWSIAVDGKRRFFYKLTTYEQWGRITAAYELSRARRGGVAGRTEA